MSTINYILCGGTGINLGLALKASARTKQNKNATMLGLDSSDANRANDAFEVEHMPAPPGTKLGDKAKGSGKKRSVNAEQAEAFVKQQLVKHKPGQYNVVIANTVGGTGSLLAIYAVREIIKLKLPVIMYLVSDHTSTTEMSNAVKTMTGFSNQVGHLKTPLPYLHTENTEDFTRGEINKRICERLDLASLFMTEENGEMDFMDFYHFLNYSAVEDVPPAMSEIRFLNQDEINNYDGPLPVSLASLFKTSDDVINVFKGTPYRTTGVFEDAAVLPKGMTSLHMILDHGETLTRLEESIQALEDHRTDQATRFVKQRSIEVNGTTDSNGVVV